MKPPVDTVRISKQGKERLILLKRLTGIEHWNILCRWALCASLREPSPPPITPTGNDGGVEMTWKVFAGDMPDALASVIRMRAQSEGMNASEDDVAHCFRAHVHRGLGYLSTERDIGGIAGFIERWLPEPHAAPTP